MRSIAMVGAGQAGLLTALSLQSLGYHVTLFNNKTPEEIRNGKILSSQGMFDSALQIERKWQLNFWDEVCPQNTSVNFVLAVPGTPQKAIEWKGKTARPYQSVDQRLKFSYWLEEFKRRGGDLIIQNLDLNDLNSIANNYELTLVAAGKGDISQAFSRDDNRSVFNQSMRALSCLYVKGMTPIKDHPGVRANITIKLVLKLI